jgi:hypothetical protein
LSQENLASPPAAHLYRVGGRLLNFIISPSVTCGPIGDVAGQHPANKMEETFHPFADESGQLSYVTHTFLLSFLDIHGFIIEMYTYEEMPEDTKIAKILIVAYI